MEGMMSTSLYFVQEGEVEVFTVVSEDSAAATEGEGGETSRTGVSDDAPAEATSVAKAAKEPPKVEESAKHDEHRQKTAAELNAELGIVGTSKPKPVEAAPEPEQSTDTPAAPVDEEKILGTYPYGGTFGEAAFVFQIYHPYSLRARWTNDVKALMLSLADYDRILETHPHELRLIRENTKDLSHASNVPDLAQKVDEAILQRKVEGIASLASCVAKHDVGRIRTMIENGFVDKDEADYDGRTAMHIAAAVGSMRVIRTLLDLKANVNVADRWGAKPIEDAVRSQRRPSQRV